MIPVFAFTAFSGTGKTTFLKKLIPCLKKRGLRVGLIKHDAHRFQMDKEGKDTHTLAEAGADCVAIADRTHAAWIDFRPHSVQDLIDRMSAVDVILLEGYHQEDYPKITLDRRATGKGYRVPPADCIAAVSDGAPTEDAPWFSLDDAEGVAEFLCRKIKGEEKE